MNRRFGFFLTGFTALASFPSVLRAADASSLSPPAILLHVGSAVVDSATACTQGPLDAGSVVTSAALDPEGNRYFVYLLGVPEGAISDPGAGYGVTGMQMAITYTESPDPNRGMKVLDWTRCSDLDFRGDDWPSSGTSNTITWMIDNCQRKNLVVAGVFTVVAYDPSIMSIAPFPPTGLVKLATCRGAEVIAENELSSARLGWLSWGGAALGKDTDGCNPLAGPCGSVTPVQAGTWGKLKSLYR
jgi:hypothetical protein